MLIQSEVVKFVLHTTLINLVLSIPNRAVHAFNLV